VSPDGRFVANVIPNGKEGNGRAEDKVEIVHKNGKVMSTYDFSSQGGEHGYGLDGGQKHLARYEANHGQNLKAGQADRLE
jgi:hypothetical protein